MRTFLILLGVLLISNLVLVGSNRDSDPPIGFSQDHAFNTDGYWYQSDARAAVDGSDSTVVKSYDRPLITWPVRALFQIGGVNHSTARSLNVLASLVAIALLAFWIRRSYGTVPALVGALLLALDPAWIACCRSTVVYPWVACWLMLVLMVGVGGGWRRWFIGVGLTGFAMYAVKSIVGVALAAFALDALVRLRRDGHLHSRRSWLVLGTVVSVGGAAFGPLTIPTFWRRVVAYTFGDGFTPWSQLLEYESRSRLFSTSGILISLAFAGWIVFRHRVVVPTDTSVRSSRAVARSVHAVIWSSLILFAVSRYTPLRYHVPLLPLVAFAAATPIAMILAHVSSVSLRCRALCRLSDSRVARWGEIAAFLCIGAYLTLMMARAASAAALPGVFGVAIIGCLFVIGIPVITLTRWVKQAVPSPVGLVMSTLIVATVVTVATLPFASQVDRALASEESSFSRTTEMLPSIILPSARVAGPYAHVITLETGHDARQMNSLRFGHGELQRRVEELGASHMATYHRPTERFRGIFERDGTPIDLIERFQLRDRSVYLYRFANSAQPRSVFEEGVAALGAEDLTTAEQKFRAVLSAFPKSAAAWCKLGVVFRGRKDFERARRCFDKSLELDPARIEAYVELANLFGSSGYLEEAYLHLEAATIAAPDCDHLQEQFDGLRRELGISGETR